MEPHPINEPKISTLFSIHEKGQSRGKFGSKRAADPTHTFPTQFTESLRQHKVPEDLRSFDAAKSREPRIRSCSSYSARQGATLSVQTAMRFPALAKLPSEELRNFLSPSKRHGQHAQHYGDMGYGSDGDLELDDRRAEELERTVPKVTEGRHASPSLFNLTQSRLVYTHESLKRREDIATMAATARTFAPNNASQAKAEIATNMPDFVPRRSGEAVAAGEGSMVTSKKAIPQVHPPSMVAEWKKEADKPVSKHAVHSRAFAPANPSEAREHIKMDYFMYSPDEQTKHAELAAVRRKTEEARATMGGGSGTGSPLRKSMRDNSSTSRELPPLGSTATAHSLSEVR